MEKLFNVIPECYIDTNLIEFLLNAKVNHQHSCNNVIKALNDKKDEFAIGIIDNDKRKVAYINDCTFHIIRFPFPRILSQLLWLHQLMLRFYPGI